MDKLWIELRMQLLITKREGMLAENKKRAGAALWQDRIEALKKLHQAGVYTWVSLEPVIFPDQTYKLIELSHEYVDEYKVGKLNHFATSTDWRLFGEKAVTMLRNYKKNIYVKEDLRNQMTGFKFISYETEMDYLQANPFQEIKQETLAL